MKNKQFGGAAVMALIAIVALIVAIAGIAFASYTSAYNYGNEMDNKLEAIRENNKNIYAQGTQKVLEIAQVPTMYKDDYAQLVKADIEGRYGKDGSRAQVQWLKEHDIHLDVSMYKKIQQTIEEFRNKFEVNQTNMIDVVRSYKTAQGSLWQGFWLRMAGFPKIDLSQFKPITTDATETVYKNGKESGPLKLR